MAIEHYNKERKWRGEKLQDMWLIRTSHLAAKGPSIVRGEIIKKWKCMD
jgi:hypothetical protein